MGRTLQDSNRSASTQPVDGRSISKPWPGDKAWLDAVRPAAAGSISELEKLVGRPIPGTGPITVREVAADELGDAYVGQYDKDVQLASISEEFEQAGVVSHELAHGWFNAAMFDSTWLSEGHAEWAAHAVGSATTPCATPDVTPDLSNWQFAEPRSTLAERETVDAQYTAACAIVTDAANQVGADQMKNVFTVLSTDAGAYPGTKDAQPGAPNTWRQWLDAVDERGMVPAGKSDASPVSDDLIKYGIATSAELTARSSARTNLAALRSEAGTSWTIPTAVYAPMEAWDFSTAGTAISDVKGTIADVEAVASELPAVTVEANPLRDRLASAATLADLKTLGDTASAQRTTADEVAATIGRTHNSNPFETVGLIGTDVNAKSSAAVSSVASLDLAGAKAKTEEIDSTLSGAAVVGLIRILAAMAVVALLAIATWRRRQGDRTKVGSASSIDESRTTIVPTPGLAAATFDDQATVN